MTEVVGNLIELAKGGNFDVIAHGCNCWCRMKRGIAPQIAYAFGADKFPLEKSGCGDYNKLGNIDYRHVPIGGDAFVTVVNAYTQFNWSQQEELRPLDYDALRLCMRKINRIFKSKHIGLPKIGSKLAGGDWNIIKVIIQEELKDCTITIVIYDES